MEVSNVQETAGSEELKIWDRERTLKQNLLGQTGYKPIFIILGLVAVFAAYFAAPPVGLVQLVKDNGQVDGMSKLYKGELETKIIEEVYADRGEALTKTDAKKKYDAWRKKELPDGIQTEADERIENELPVLVAHKAMVMIGVLIIAALFFATEALPVGATAVLIAVIMYWGNAIPSSQVSKAYAKDAVFFIFGVLALAVGVSKVKLDRRIGVLLLSKATNMKRFVFIFCPTFAMAASFLSEHALVAFLAPVFMGVYAATIRKNGIKADRKLAVFLMLVLCFAGNHGGPGSPAAGGRNAIMVGFFQDAGAPISFGQWMLLGFPFVPVMGLVVASFMYMSFRGRFQVPDFNAAEVVKEEAEKLGKFGGKEAIMAGVLAVVVILWIVLGEEGGMGGPALLGVVAMFFFRIVRWREINRGVSWEVVGLYAGACAMGYGLEVTGAALYLATMFINALPGFFTTGLGLPIAVSIFVGTLTNFMSDGATVAVTGPITLPMAKLAGIHMWKTGLATAFSSSFANFLVVGTPNNAIAYGMCRDPETGERLMDGSDFLRYGIPMTILALLVLWVWIFLIWWNMPLAASVFSGVN